jgi:hypothetical protein
VTGNTASAHVTYLGPEGQTDTEVRLPWQISVDLPHGTAAELRATANTGGSLTCRIKWEGHTVRFDVGSSNTTAWCTSSASA